MGRTSELGYKRPLRQQLPSHYDVLDEREIASGLKDWLVGIDKPDLQRATHLSEELASPWRKVLGGPGRS